MNWRDFFDQILEFARSNPLNAIAVGAAALALASTPIAFVLLGQQEWFQARRGRVLQRPAFGSIVAAMLLVMGIPAIFLALLIKSQYFDKDRYEFDPNRTISVLDQGRKFEVLRLQDSLYKADEGLRAEKVRLDQEKKTIADSVKALDKAMLQAIRDAGPQGQTMLSPFNKIAMQLADVRKWSGVDAPQQLLDITGRPEELRTVGGNNPGGNPGTVAAAVPPAAPSASNSVAAGGASGGPAAGFDNEVDDVPEGQRSLARMLPLSDLPAGWVVGKSGDRHLETFNAENLYEKMDGRAESFIQYGVKGMAYAYYHPQGNEESEAQLYVFEMGDPLKALGKFGSEKPDEVTPVPLGSEGYTSAGSVFFYADRYYTQIVLTQDDPKMAVFAMELAKRVLAKQKPTSAVADSGSSAASTASSAATSPEDIFKLLPSEPKRSSPKYVTRDVFGYSFLSDVFMADYQEGETSWQGFVRPYEDAKAAQEVFERYLDTAKKDGAEVKEIADSGADKMIVSSSIGLFDVVMLKGNAVAGANGATAEAPALAFAKAMAKSMPKDVPRIVSSDTKTGEASGSSEGQ